MGAQAAGAAPRSPLRRALPWAGVVIGLWAVIPPYVGPELNNLNTKVEIADHVVPSIAMLAVSVAVLVRARRPVGDQSFPLVAGFVVLLAGLWMTATHIPLVNQARRGEAGVTDTAAAWHTTPGVVVLLLGLVWVAAWWSAAGAEPPATPAARPARPGDKATRR